MNSDTYIKSVIKRLKCSKKRRTEIKKELEADICSAVEQGESWEMLEVRMGNPVSVAEEFNENMPKLELDSYKKEKTTKIIMSIVAIIAIIPIAIYWMLPKSTPISSNGVFDEQTVISQAERIIELLNAEDYLTIQNQCANDGMKLAFEGNKIPDVKEQIGSNWGVFKAYTSVYTCETRQMGKKFAVAQVTALYENRSVMYTISFDKDMKLAGLYMK